MEKSCKTCYYNGGEKEGFFECDILNVFLKDKIDVKNKDNQKFYKFLVNELKLKGDVFVDEKSNKILIKNGYCKNYVKKK